MMQEHRKQDKKARAKAKDSWKCTNTHFENVLNSNDKTLMKYLGGCIAFMFWRL
jgi:hypothetical protein